ncbi:MAG: serine--tRNA ligase [Actinomycetota bacterium]|nr:serine--tRNA ligase [Actinomycetota bacterium]
MLDPRRLRTDLEAVKAGLARRGVDLSEIDRAVDLEARERELRAVVEGMRARVRSLSKEVGQARRSGDLAAAEAKADQSRALGEEERKIDAEVTRLAGELRDMLLRTPNLPADDAPDGASEHDNVVVRTEGYDPDAYGDHQRTPHWDIGATLGILDLERGAKLSGSMFPVFRRQGATLVRALCQLALDRNADAYEEIRPPSLVRTDTMVSTGHLPKFVDEGYHLERDDLWAIPTAEVPLTSLARDEILAEADLPMRLMASTPCFRREAGAAGRDTRGLLRVHEFDKVEILAYATPAQAADVHADILARAEGSLRALGLAYRVVDLCAGDLGGSAAARSTSRSTPPAATCGWRCRRSRGSATTRPAGPTSATARPRAAGPQWSIPSTAPHWPSPGSGPRWWRRTAGPTGPSPCPTPCGPTSGAPAASAHEHRADPLLDRPGHHHPGHHRICAARRLLHHVERPLVPPPEAR